MADSHPFANAGLGMFGTAERSYANKAMNPQGGGNNLLGLLASMFYKPNNPYSLQSNMSPTSALGQGVAPPMVPGGIGVNPAKPSKLGATPSTSFQLPALPTAPGISAAPAAGADLNNMIDSFWGAGTLPGVK
jgi:hypothetical protein